VIEEDFSSVQSEDIARQIVSEREAEHAVALQGQVGADVFVEEDSGCLRLRVLIKGDVHGSVRAFIDYLQSLPTDSIKVEVIRSGLGDVSLADIEYARRLDAHVYGFGVNIVRDAEYEARARNIPVICHTVIFHLIDSLKDTLGGMLPPHSHAVLQGYAEVLMKIDLHGKGRNRLYCAGCFVKHGQLKTGGTFRVRREQRVVFEGPLISLQHYKNKVSSVEKGSECSLSLANFSDYQKGDIIECITMELTKRIFDDGRKWNGSAPLERAHAFA